MTFTPTPEQQAAIEAFATGGDMKLEAGAGTGKTSTLKLLANLNPDARGIYFAYNKSIADEAAKEFPSSVECKTAHSMAYRAVMRMPGWGAALRNRLNAPRLPARETAKALGARHLNLGEGKYLSDTQVARIAMEAVTLFCYSDAEQPEKWHVPTVNGVELAAQRAALVNEVLPMARKAWKDLSDPNGRLRFPHDAYLKLWAMTNPVLEGDYLMLDEAQDANPLIADLVDKQTHMQRIAVGDAAQSIYAWRGATDFLSTMPADHHLFLSQSFRFGEAVAAEANKWLELLNSPMRIRGTKTIPSVLGTLDRPSAILCRTNAECVSQLMKHHASGIKAAIVGGGDDVRRLALAAIELREKGQTWHAELCAFTSWGQVQDYVEEDAAGADLKVAVKLIDEYGAQSIIDAIERAVAPAHAEVIVSTAHKSKGLEWDRVKVADDFKEVEPKSEDLPARPEAMLAYVTVTRAKKVLDRSGLAWVDNYMAGGLRTVAV